MLSPALSPSLRSFRRSLTRAVIFAVLLPVLAGPLAAQTPPAAGSPGAATPETPAPVTPAPAMPAPEAPAAAAPASPGAPPADAGTGAAGASAASDDPLQRRDGFGEEVQMVPVPVLQKAGKSNWDDGYQTLVDTLKAVYAELDRLHLKRTGAPFIIYTMTDDDGFEFEAAVPFLGATTEKPGEDFEFSASPAGKALRFTHRGPYDAMDPTYEQIANLLDAKDLEAQDLYVEEYRSDPTTTSQDDLVIDIWVPLK